MSSILLSCIGSSHYNRASPLQLDSYFSNLVDILPPECYFDANALLQLKSTANALKSDRTGNQQHVSPKMFGASTVTQTAHLLEIGEEEQKTQSTTRAKLHNRIKKLEVERKGNREADNESTVKKEARRSKVTRKTKAIQLKKNSTKKGSRVGDVINRSSGENMPLFSRFTFMNGKDQNANDRQKDVKRKLSNQKLLALAEKKEDKVNALRLKDSASARQVETKEAWQKALDKARGIKVKDDPKLLRKSIRKEHSLKRRSARKWADREQHEAANTAERQAKRQRNLDKAKNARVKAKMRRAVAKGHFLPGF